MAEKHNIIRSGWCWILMFALTAMGFNSCHRAQKIVVDDDNITPIDTVPNRLQPPRFRDPGEMIALYGVPPSRFKNIEKRKINPQNK